MDEAITNPVEKPKYHSRFKKGNKVAAGPRRSTIKTRQLQAEALKGIFAEADGDPILIQQLMLKRGADLQLDVPTTIRLCDKLAPYKEAKKASLDIKHEVVPAYNVIENRVEPGALPSSSTALINVTNDEES